MFGSGAPEFLGPQAWVSGTMLAQHAEDRGAEHHRPPHGHTGGLGALLVMVKPHEEGSHLPAFPPGLSGLLPRWLAQWLPALLPSPRYGHLATCREILGWEKGKVSSSSSHTIRHGGRGLQAEFHSRLKIGSAECQFISQAWKTL